MAPSYNPSNTNNNNNNNNPVESSKDLQNGGNGTSATTAAGRPAPVPNPSDLFEESENKNKTIVAQPVLPLVPVDGCTGSSCLPGNGCTGTSCVPPSPPFNCIPGFPCPVENLNIIDPLHPTKTPPPPQPAGLPAKIKVWAIETVETHVKNAPSMEINVSPTSQTTTTVVSSNVVSQPTQPQSKTPVPGPVEFPSFPPGVEVPTYQQVALPKQETTEAKDSTPKTQDTILYNPLNIQGPTVLETTTYQQNKTTSGQPISSPHPAAGVQGPQNQYNIEYPSSNLDGSSNTVYQYASTPLPPGETTPSSEQPPQFSIFNLGTETSTVPPSSPSSTTVTNMAIEAKDDGHGGVVPPPDFPGSEDNTTPTTSTPQTTFNPYLPVENQPPSQGDETPSTTTLPFATISTPPTPTTTTPATTTTTYQPVEVYPGGQTSSKFIPILYFFVD